MPALTPLEPAHHKTAAVVLADAFLDDPYLPYYRSHGFDVIGVATIPGGVPNWFMQRAPSSE